MKSTTNVFLPLLSAGLFLAACAPAEPSSDGTGGKPGSGGATVVSSTGGATVSSTGGATVLSTGGASSGGVSASGGAPETGGRANTGGAASGGAMSSGGAVGSGGAGPAGGAGGRSNNGGGATGTAGTTGAAGAAGGGTGTFADVSAIMGMSCGTGMCHDGTMHVDLRNTAGLHDRMVGMPNGSKTMAMCKTKALIVPNSPATSVISQVVKAAVPGCTNARMPDNCPGGMPARACLTAAQIATIDGWINAGAPP